MKKVSSDGRKLKLMELKRRWHICLKSFHGSFGKEIRKRRTVQKEKDEQKKFFHKILVILFI